MLLPSALPCDLRRPSSRSRFPPSRCLFTTPPPEDFPPSNGLLGTCRALQSLLNGSPAPSPRLSKPPRLQSPLDIRPSSTTPSARSRKHRTTPQPQPRKQPSPQPQAPRGANKRRRDSSEVDGEDFLDIDGAEMRHRTRFATPKRRRHAPYDLPLGLSQSDFYSLHSPPVTQSPPSPALRQQELDGSGISNRVNGFNPDAPLPSIEEADESQSCQPRPPSSAEDWTADDDQRLVQVVLEKFQLSQRDWDDCARRMGRDHASVGRRWQALVGEGNVGLRRGGRMVRGRLNEGWM